GVNLWSCSLCTQRKRYLKISRSLACSERLFLNRIFKSRVLEIDCFAAVRNGDETLKQVQCDNINKELQ
ncbi:MAG: hypothetical protein J5706_05400, partial [Elusimicrobiales bacterium]|nr:hypothetical protein [Elusimicrobiales bacterium]